MFQASQTITPHALIYSTLFRTGLFSLLWWILTDGTASSWWLGAPAVLLATAISARVLPPSTIVWSAIPEFVIFFLLHSLLGGLDVARRVFQPDMPIAPTLYEYSLRLPAGLPQVFLANSIGLLPGTLSAELERDVLTVHILDENNSFLTEIETLERKIARIFALSINS